MRTTILSLFTIIALMVTASAAQELMTDIVITDYGNDSKPKVLARAHLRTGNGKQTVIRIDWIEYDVIATLASNNTVDVATVFIRLPHGRSARTIVIPKRNARLGETLEVSAGTLFFSTKTSLAQ